MNKYGMHTSLRGRRELESCQKGLGQRTADFRAGRRTHGPLTQHHEARTQAASAGCGLCPRRMYPLFAFLHSSDILVLHVQYAHKSIITSRKQGEDMPEEATTLWGDPIPPAAREEQGAGIGEGYIIDIITGEKEVKDTPREQVRQLIAKALHEQYNIPYEDMEADVVVRLPEKRRILIDIAVFHRSEEHTSELQSHRDLHSFPTRRSSDLSAARAVQYPLRRHGGRCCGPAPGEAAHPHRYRRIPSWQAPHQREPVARRLLPPDAADRQKYAPALAR